MLRLYCKLIIIGCIALGCGVVQAFAVSEANDTLDKVLAAKNISTVTSDELSKTLDVITSLQDQAQSCVQKGDEQLTEFEKDLEFLDAAISPELNYIQKKITGIKSSTSECRLFVLRSQDLIDGLGSKLQALIAQELLSREHTIWRDLMDVARSPNILLEDYKLHKLVENSGYKIFTEQYWIYISLLLIMIIMFGMQLRVVINKSIVDTKMTSLTAKMLQALYCVLRCYVAVLLPVLVFCSIMLGYSWYHDKIYILTWISIGAVVYILFIMLSQFLFKPPKPAQGFSELPANVLTKLTLRLRMFGVISYTAFVVYSLYIDQNENTISFNLIWTIFTILITVNVINVFSAVNEVPVLLYRHKNIYICFRVILLGLLCVILGLEATGHHNLTEFILQGIVLTFACTALSSFAYRIFSAVLNSFGGNNYTWQKKLHYYFGTKTDQVLPEILLLHLVMTVMVFGCWVFLVLMSWQMADIYLRNIMEGIIDGFTLANIYIVPSKILTGMVAFSLLAMLSRLLRYKVKRQVSFRAERSFQDSLATIIGYIAFSSSLVIALLIAGFNFTGLAIIAGALSVGIGFGLQNIVNNVVSGIILLIERPIKVGDRIVVGGTEGFVSKISIRSTRLSTIHSSDVIVPNSEIITSQVTNFMFHDHYSTVYIKVGVEQGADVELVSKLLAEIAAKHPVVISSTGDKPGVFLTDFANGILSFEVWFKIKDINQAFTMKSDLRFSIEKEFKKHDIKIALPQYGVHIKK